jgi:peptide/nickel transport system ATP-binding protein
MAMNATALTTSRPLPASRADSPLLRVEGLSVCFGSDDAPLPAVDRASFTVERGETVCIVGESGSGKTATALSILRLEGYKGARIVAGDIVFDGKGLVGRAEAELQALRGQRIGMVFQEPMTALDPVFSIGDQIVETIRRHERVSASDARARALDLLARVHIPDPSLRLAQIPQQLSGGMRQRALIAMALACGPDLLIADEPTTALDVTTQAQILALLKELQQTSGMAILLITHDLGIAAQVADRVVVMYAGRVAEQAPVRDLFETPWHPYTRGLLRSSIPKAGARAKLTPIPGAIPQLDALPTGCRFHPRCPSATAACRDDAPASRTLGSREVACWNALQEGPRVVSLAPVGERPVTPRTDPLVEMAHLTKDYESRGGLFSVRRRLRAVDDVTLAIDRGETFGLVGESGCGKTTVGRLLTQLETPTAGSIHFDGTALGAGSQAVRRRVKRDMQMIFQDPTGSIDPRWTIEEVVGEPLVAHEYVDQVTRRERVEQLLRDVGMDPAARTRRAHEFSGGQRQRIAIARAIALRPKFVVADEAVSALDLSVQAQIINLLDELRDKLGLTCLFIGHGLHVVRHLSDRIGVMYMGRLVEVGPATQVFDRPAHHYSEALIASVPEVDPSRRADPAIPTGEPPPAAEAGAAGCAFRSRCPAATDRCRTEAPSLEFIAPGRLVACHHPRV